MIMPEKKFSDRIILASGSPRRAELLQQADISFRIQKSDAEELQSDSIDPIEILILNAVKKAEVVAKNNKYDWVLGADTLVCLGRKIYGKPTCLPHAERMLLDFQGKTHKVITGVALINQSRQITKTFYDVTDVAFKHLTIQQIRHYLALINPLDKAGGYAIQEYGELIVEKTDGSFSNVIGLPIEKLLQELNNI